MIRSYVRSSKPEHTRYRRQLTGQFTVRRMRQLTGMIERIAAEHLDAMESARKEPGAPVDLVQAYAQPIPGPVISELLGVPATDRARFQALMSDRRRLRHDREHARAGHVRAAHPPRTARGVPRAAIDDPAAVNRTVEELLRYLTIVPMTMRTALEDLELGGHLVKQGETVTVSISAANRDSAHFPDADALDVHRDVHGHMAFGHGVHQCLGQQLARVEMQVGFPALFRRFPTLRLAVPPEEVPMRDDMAIYGVHRLPVTWD